MFKIMYIVFQTICKSVNQALSHILQKFRSNYIHFNCYPLPYWTTDFEIPQTYWRSRKVPFNKLFSSDPQFGNYLTGTKYLQAARFYL